MPNGILRPLCDKQRYPLNKLQQNSCSGVKLPHVPMITRITENVIIRVQHVCRWVSQSFRDREQC